MWKASLTNENIKKKIDSFSRVNWASVKLTNTIPGTRF